MLKFPFTDPGGGGEHLESFVWKGHREPYEILDGQHYWDNMGKIKGTYCNCHGNSAHAYGAETFTTTSAGIETEVEAAAGGEDVSQKEENRTLVQIENDISVGDILVFNSTVSGAGHSAYVCGKTACSSASITLWACNAGVLAKGTEEGFDEVTLKEYLEEPHDCAYFSYYYVSSP